MLEQTIANRENLGLAALGAPDLLGDGLQDRGGIGGLDGLRRGRGRRERLDDLRRAIADREGLNSSMQRIEGEVGSLADDLTVSSRIIDVPIMLNDPWTHEVLMKFRDRHQPPSGPGVFLLQMYVA